MSKDWLERVLGCHPKPVFREPQATRLSQNAYRTDGETEAMLT